MLFANFAFVFSNCSVNTSFTSATQILPKVCRALKLLFLVKQRLVQGLIHLILVRSRLLEIKVVPLLLFSDKIWSVIICNNPSHFHYHSSEEADCDENHCQWYLVFSSGEQVAIRSVTPFLLKGRRWNVYKGIYRREEFHQVQYVFFPFLSCWVCAGNRATTCSNRIVNGQLFL